jgi:hypothetical protein
VKLKSGYSSSNASEAAFSSSSEPVINRAENKRKTHQSFDKLDESQLLAIAELRGKVVELAK